MAKLRSNHSKSDNGSGNVVKVGLFAAIIGGLFMIFNRFSGGSEPVEDDSTVIEENYNEYETEDKNSKVRGEDYLPGSTTGQVVGHRYYTLSYSEEHEQAEWVAYILYKNRLEKDWVERSELFVQDPYVDTKSAKSSDYRNSGYHRGHLVPAADMAFDEKAMEETFFMSNISPQAANFNKGIWRELEELTRSWAKKNKKLYVVTGPVLAFPPKGTIGDNEVTVPQAFYKVLLDLTDPQEKGIAFVIPNEVSFEPLYKFAVSIDYVEEATGIDFFPELMSKELEEELEASFNSDLWEFSKTKHNQRVEEWNLD